MGPTARAGRTATPVGRQRDAPPGGGAEFCGARLPAEVRILLLARRAGSLVEATRLDGRQLETP